MLRIFFCSRTVLLLWRPYGVAVVAVVRCYGCGAAAFAAVCMLLFFAAVRMLLFLQPYGVAVFAAVCMLLFLQPYGVAVFAAVRMLLFFAAVRMLLFFAAVRCCCFCSRTVAVLLLELAVTPLVVLLLL